MTLARTIHAEACRLGVEPVSAEVYARPTRIRNGRWGFKNSKLWYPDDGKFMVGFDVDDAEFTTQIYRRSIANQTPGGRGNPTYSIGVTRVFQDSELDRLERSLWAIVA